MKRFAALLVCLGALIFGGFTPSFAQTPTLIPQSTLQGNINSLFLDNNNGLITPYDARSVLLDITVPEYESWTDGVHTVTPVINATFSALTIGGTFPNVTVTPNWATTSDVWGGASHVFIDPSVANAAIAPQTVSEIGGTFTISFGAAINVELPMDAGCPCTIANPGGVYAGLSGNLSIVQSSTGSDTISGWGSTWKFSGGTQPTLSTAANAVDVLPFYCRTTTFCVVTFVGNVR